MPSGLLESQATVEDIVREVSRLKDIVVDAVEEGVESAVKAIKKGREAARDSIYDARRTVKQKPFQAMGVVFAAGVLTGSLVAWLSSRRR
jgi:ElaB/YqjD/DUF883 family membrane-anchored ribosome-binding protein